MSWDVDLIAEHGGIAEVPSHTEGGTYAVGGSGAAELNVTYNYGAVYRKVWGRNLEEKINGRGAAETIPELEAAVLALGTERSLNYWEATPGNAGYALSILLGWAKLHPTGRWEVC